MFLDLSELPVDSVGGVHYHAQMDDYEHVERKIERCDTKVYKGVSVAQWTVDERVVGGDTAVQVVAEGQQGDKVPHQQLKYPIADDRNY